MKTKFHLLISFVAISALVMHLCPAASADEQNEIRTLINQDGWELPGLRGSRVVSRRQVLQGDATRRRTFLSVLRPKDGSVLLDQRAHYFAREDGTLLVQPIAIRTSSITRYDVGGKPFAYAYFGGGLRIMVTPDAGKLLIPLGCSGGLAYYDEDGDGVFERLDVLDGTAGFEVRIPEWVVKQISAAP